MKFLADECCDMGLVTAMRKSGHDVVYVPDGQRTFYILMYVPRFSLPVDDGTAEFYAHVYRILKRKGKPIPTNDLWIAATAFQHGFAVFTYVWTLFGN